MMTSSIYVLLLACFCRVLYACDFSTCPDLQCSDPVKVPGKCCPECPCEQDGVYYAIGDLVYTGNDCEVCECYKSGIFCAEIPCRPISCSNPVMGDGDCCPSCGCLYEGYVYEYGSDISVDDPCMECRCGNDGRVMCRSQRCPAAQCSNPYQIRGECCKKCGCKTRQGEEYSFGLIQPVDRCRPCTCNSDGTISCAEPACPAITCSKKQQYIPDGECCPICRCLYKSEYYNIGDELPSNDACETNCVCSPDGERVCDVMMCAAVHCENPVYIRGQCCPQCGCEDKQGVIHQFGVMEPVDKCNPCTCTESGEIQCTPVDCPAIACSGFKKRMYTLPGECCPKCFCSDKLEVFYPGDEMPIPANDPCAVSCTCGADGLMACENMQCPAVDCSNPVTIPGECCPKCGCLNKRELIPFGPVQGDPCVKCECTQNGTIECGDPQVCPNIKCVSGYYQQPPDAPKQCCKQCRCKVAGKSYKPGDAFEGPKCQTCECQYSGRVSCEKHVCPKVLECANPVLKKGDCCYTCPDGPSCMYKKAVIPFGHYREFGKIVCTCLGGNGTWYPNAFCASKAIAKSLNPLVPLLDEFGYDADEVDTDKKKAKKDKKKNRSRN